MATTLMGGRDGGSRDQSAFALRRRQESRRRPTGWRRIPQRVARRRLWGQTRADTPRQHSSTNSPRRSSSSNGGRRRELRPQEGHLPPVHHRNKVGLLRDGEVLRGWVGRRPNKAARPPGGGVLAVRRRWGARLQGMVPRRSGPPVLSSFRPTPFSSWRTCRRTRRQTRFRPCFHRWLPPSA
jgi:hypothetical protein